MTRPTRLPACESRTPVAPGPDRRSDQEPSPGSRSETRWRPPHFLSALFGLALLAGLGLAQFPPPLPEVDTDQRVDTDLIGTNSSSLPRIVATEDGYVHVVWQDYREATWQIWYRRLLPGAVSFDGTDVKLSELAAGPPFAVNHTAPRIATDGVNLFVTWHARGAGVEHILFVRSADGGLTWSPAGLGAGPSLNVTMVTEFAGPPELVADDVGRVHVVWSQSDLLFDQIYLATSLDAGLTWTTPLIDQPVNTDLLGHSETPRVATDGAGNVHVVWLDHRDPDLRDLYTRRSSDFGLSFVQAERRLGPPSTGDHADVVARLLADGRQLVLVAWIEIGEDSSGKPLTWLRSTWSMDGGASFRWGTALITPRCGEVLPDPGMLAGGSGGGGPSVLGGGSSGGGGLPPGGSLGPRRDLDNGTSGLETCPPPLLTNVDLDADADGRVYAVYGKIEQPVLFQPTDVVVSVFDPDALRWGPEIVLSRVGSVFPDKGMLPSLPRARVSAAGTGGAATVVWMHSANGYETHTDVNAAWTTDGGLSWRGPSGVTTKPGGPGRSRSGHPDVVALPGLSAVVWDDRRSWTNHQTLPLPPGSPVGAPDVYINTITPTTTP